MKRLRPEVSACIKGHGGLDTAIDDVIISAYNITDGEYDTICEMTSDEELGVFLDPLFNASMSSFALIREGLKIRNKYVEYYRNFSKV
jgi:hypothetical protein